MQLCGEYNAPWNKDPVLKHCSTMESERLFRVYVGDYWVSEFSSWVGSNQRQLTGNEIWNNIANASAAGLLGVPDVEDRALQAVAATYQGGSAWTLQVPVICSDEGTAVSDPNYRIEAWVKAYMRISWSCQRLSHSVVTALFVWRSHPTINQKFQSPKCRILMKLFLWQTI